VSKTALLFAGQGAQVVGMAQDLAQVFPAAKAWFDRANAALGYDLAAICFNGPEAELTKTEHAQPGIFLVSWIALELLKERAPDLRYEATAGLSLGEFTALTAAGALSFEDGLRTVRQRGRFMQEACEITRGGMAAIIGLDEGPTREVCAQAGVVLANLTAQPHEGPEQIRARLVDQVTASVRWEESMRYLLGQGFRRFIELGPGTALSGFLKRIDKEAEILNVADVPSLETTARSLTSGPGRRPG
jgi:malonyl CoA-acyl carrier protein transacylase